MTGSGGSPCGACKFLRRKCMRGCVFGPHFCHEQGAAHFAAIHKVFGASNVSKLLAHLPATDRPEAAVTIAYEAQARLQDPIYGCVSHIFALQQQVFTLQAQLASLKEEAAKSLVESNNTNPNHKLSPSSSYQQDLHSWFHESSNNNNMPQLVNPFSDNASPENLRFGYSNDPNLNNYHGNTYNNESSNTSHGSFEEGSMSCLDTMSRQWVFQDSDDLQSVAFGGYAHYS